MAGLTAPELELLARAKDILGGVEIDEAGEPVLRLSEMTEAEVLERTCEMCQKPRKSVDMMLVDKRMRRMCGRCRRQVGEKPGLRRRGGVSEHQRALI